MKIFIDELQNEYFLRTSIDNKLLIGLHPIRSKIISELLIDPEFDDVEKLACDGLKVVDENDLNKLLLNYFYDSSELNDFLKELDNYTIKNWQTVENILRSLFWLGIKEFAALNMELIKEFKEEFHTTIFLLIDDFGIDLSGIKKINETRVNKIESQIKRLQGKDLVYEKARKWLSTFKPPSLFNLSEEDWNGLAYTLFWMHRFQIEKNLNFSQLSGIDKLELTQLNSFANILLSLNLFSKESKVVYNSYLPSFIDQIKVDYRIVSLQQDNTSVKANYIFDVETKNQESTKNYIHQKSVDIANLLRKAFPEKEFYSTQGYGHKLLILPDQNDDSIKRIPKKSIPILWRVELNGIFHQFIEYQYRLKNWKDYVDSVIEVRRTGIDLLNDLNSKLELFFSKHDFVSLQTFFESFDSSWYNDKLSMPIQLPKIALDKWGFSKQQKGNNSDNLQESSKDLLPKGKQKFLSEFGEYLNISRDFYNSLSNFYRQIESVYVYNFLTHGKREKDLSKAKKHLQQYGITSDEVRLSVVNLFEAIQNLKKFQYHFNLHFSKFHTPDFLQKLDRGEESVYLKTAILWKKFTQPKHNSKKKRKRNTLPSIAYIRKEIERNIDDRLSILCKKKHIDFYDIVNFDENGFQRTAILFDVSNPIQTYLVYSDLLNCIQECFLPASHLSIKKLVIDLYFSPLYIIPLVHDKTLNNTYYEIPSYIFMNEKGQLTFESIALYYKELTNHLLSSLDIRLWSTEIPDLINPTNLLANNLNISLYLNHLIQVDKLAESLDGDKTLDIEAIEDYCIPKLKTIADKLIDLFELCNKATSDIPVDYEFIINDDERREFAEIYLKYSEYIIEFGELFNIHEIEDGKNDIVKANIVYDDIIKWNIIFQQEMQDHAFFIYLFWAAELIKKHI